MLYNILRCLGHIENPSLVTGQKPQVNNFFQGFLASRDPEEIISSLEQIRRVWGARLTDELQRHIYYTHSM